jgi:hypothetical protein
MSKYQQKAQPQPEPRRDNFWWRNDGSFGGNPMTLDRDAFLRASGEIWDGLLEKVAREDLMGWQPQTDRQRMDQWLFTADLKGIPREDVPMAAQVYREYGVAALSDWIRSGCPADIESFRPKAGHRDDEEDQAA